LPEKKRKDESSMHVKRIKAAVLGGRHGLLKS